jgi:hypothetical protein
MSETKLSSDSSDMYTVECLAFERDITEITLGIFEFVSKLEGNEQTGRDEKEKLRKVIESSTRKIEAAEFTLSKYLIESKRALSEYPLFLQVFVRPLYFFLCTLPFAIFLLCPLAINIVIDKLFIFFIENPTLALINFITGSELNKQVTEEAKRHFPVENTKYTKISGSNLLTPDEQGKYEEIRASSNEMFRLAFLAVFVSLTTMRPEASKGWFFASWLPRAALLAVLSFVLIAQKVVRELLVSAFLAVDMVLKIIQFTVLSVLNIPRFLFKLPENLQKAWQNRAALAENFKTMLFENRFALPSNVLLTLSAVGVAAVIFGVNPLLLGIVAAASSVSTLFLSQKGWSIGQPKLRLALSILFFLAAAALVFFAFGGMWFPSIADFIPHLPHLIIPLSIPAQVAIAAVGTWFMVYLPTLITDMVKWGTEPPEWDPNIFSAGEIEFMPLPSPRGDRTAAADLNQDSRVMQVKDKEGNLLGIQAVDNLQGSPIDAYAFSSQGDFLKQELFNLSDDTKCFSESLSFFPELNQAFLMTNKHKAPNQPHSYKPLLITADLSSKDLSFDSDEPTDDSSDDFAAKALDEAFSNLTHFS